MLKALELAGFKSFADKTRFEFPAGITVVVGPNGSGKSNVVDAVKWVLGEQSVKSLRGKEMADCIFNGSGSRQPQHSAECTLTFSNESRLLAIDTPEVHITRRVYRSGEGEYLINRQPCRLRDIRDLLAGTGIGVDAYSIIEQGKVDALLQSSPRDRRAVFEEAAGISRFKAKKIESLRRLERVEQNLLRLADIVEEVENRLKSVRMQANKARRYRELADRLQELRTQVGLADWRHLSERLEQLDAEILAIRDEAGAANAQAEAVEARVLEVEIEQGDVGELLRDCESRLSENRAQIAAIESTIEHQRSRCRELEDQSARHRQQISAMSLRAGDQQQHWHETRDALRLAEADLAETSRQLADAEFALGELNTALETLRRENEDRRNRFLELMRDAAALGNQMSAVRSEIATCEAASARQSLRHQELDVARQSAADELAALAAHETELVAAADAARQAAGEAQQRLADLRREQTSQVEELSSLRQRHSGLVERAAVLQELEERQEGLGAGVKDVLARAHSPQPGPYRHILGLVAELFRVNVETAPLVDAALGELTGYLAVTSDPELIAHLEAHGQRLPGRVGFVRLDPLEGTSADDLPDLDGQPGVLGRADRFVDTSPELLPLARRLLGRTWIVERLPHALALAGQFVVPPSGGRTSVQSATTPPPERGSTNAADLRFVTLAGEVVSADGTLVVGPRHAATGLISRRSELRALHQQIEQIDGRIKQAEVEVAQLGVRLAQQEELARSLAADSQQAAAALAQHRVRLQSAENRLSQLEEQQAALTTEVAATQTQLATASQRLAEVEARSVATDAMMQELEAQIATAAAELMRRDEERQVQSRQTMAIRLEQVKREERIASLQTTLAQFEHDQQERRRAIDETRNHLEHCRERLRQSTWAILRAESQIAELYLAKESLAAETVGLVNRRESLRRDRADLAQQAAKLRSQVRKLEEQLHARELSAGEIRLERNTLVGRLRDDYGIELAELEHTPTEEERRAREEVDQEIAELRRKINNIGNVNLDALSELEELESRYNNLSSQYKDLSSAKNSLEQIIHKINADSRRLFADTLETVRGHFQTLFRKLFGGGQADIVLEEGVDILDSGIDIVARPPGKEPRNISLLSGGERTLTCVAMLLAIFRSRPSPFCVLDEVDAALDEANIERFVGVLEEFLAWTQFIVVTHSKKTMACANTLYGVTMQESGVSKRVAVRFEDVSDDGEILPAALNDDEQAA